MAIYRVKEVDPGKWVVTRALIEAKSMLQAKKEATRREPILNGKISLFLYDEWGKLLSIKDDGKWKDIDWNAKGVDFN